MADNGPQLGIPDTVDLMDPNAQDPDPAEISDPDDPSYVEAAASRCTPAAPCRTPWDDE
jgi:hypothetical protein